VTDQARVCEEQPRSRAPGPDPLAR